MPDSDKPYLSFLVEPELLGLIDEFRFQNHFPTRSAALKWLLNQHLDRNAAPLSKQIEYAILEIITFGQEDFWQGSMGEWDNRVRRTVNRFAGVDLRDAFKRLHERGLIELSKPSGMRRRGIEYDLSGKRDDDFFWRGSFNASLTPNGREYWDTIRQRNSETPKGKKTSNAG